MKLTAKQEHFAQEVAAGKTQSDAYRAAYSTARMKNETIWSRASVLMANEKVKARVDELKKELSNKQLWTREMSVKALVKAYNVATQTGNASGMTGAVKELNLMHGYNEPVKLDHTTNGESMNAPVIIELVAYNPDEDQESED